MTNYEYIEVALLRQEESTARVDYIYASEGGNTSWVSSISDPRSNLDYFLNAREAYLQWTTKEGHFFSLVVRDQFSNRQGVVAIVIRIASGYGLSGRQIVRCLNQLRKKMVEEKHVNNECVEEVFRANDLSRAGKMFDSWRIPADFVSREGAAPCFRTYVSAFELEHFLTFPRQKEYEYYSRVIYVAATTSLRPGVELYHVVAPIKNVYTIVTPAGVECSRPAASAGDRVMLSYSKAGYMTIREAVIVGRPSMLVTYDGATMMVKSAAACRLSFVKRIPLTVRSAKGGTVTGYTVSINGRPVNTMDPYLEVTEEELQSNEPIAIQVSSNGYEVLKIDKSPHELAMGQPMELQLKPIEQGITLRLDFGEGRVFEQQISIEKNTPEYSQLHSGSFHGFRAHRLTIAGAGEIYNVDVRSGVKPTSPNFGNATPPAPKPTEIHPPQIENVAESLQAEADATAEQETPMHRHRRRRRVNVGMIAGIVCVIAALAGAAYYFSSAWQNSAQSFDPTEPAVEVEKPVSQPADTIAVQPAVQQSVDTVAAPETSVAVPAVTTDDAYLNRAAVWVRDSLSTDEALALYDAMVDGRIADVASNGYFATAGRATNQQAIKLIDMLWAAHGTSTERSNERCMQKYKGKAINLKDLFQDVARYRSPEPNKQPRPKK